MSLGYLLTPTFQAVGTDGLPLVNGKVKVYIASSSELATTYSDFNYTLNSNPVVLNSLGQGTLIASDMDAYDIYVYDRDNVLQYSRLNVTIVSTSSLEDINGTLSSTSSSLTTLISGKMDSFEVSGNLSFNTDKSLLTSYPYESSDQYIEIDNSPITSGSNPTVSLKTPKRLMIQSPLSAIETSSRLYLGLDADYITEEDLSSKLSSYASLNDLNEEISNIEDDISSLESKIDDQEFSWTQSASGDDVLGVLNLNGAVYPLYYPDDSTDVSYHSIMQRGTESSFYLGTLQIDGSANYIEMPYTGMNWYSGSNNNSGILIGEYQFSGDTYKHYIDPDLISSSVSTNASRSVVYGTEGTIGPDTGFYILTGANDCLLTFNASDVSSRYFDIDASLFSSNLTISGSDIPAGTYWNMAFKGATGASDHWDFVYGNTLPERMRISFNFDNGHIYVF